MVPEITFIEKTNDRFLSVNLPQLEERLALSACDFWLLLNALTYNFLHPSKASAYGNDDNLVICIIFNSLRFYAVFQGQICC